MVQLMQMDGANLDSVFSVASIEDHLGEMPGAVHVLGAQRQRASLVIGRARLDAIHSGRAADLAISGDSQSAEGDYARHVSDWLFFQVWRTDFERFTDLSAVTRVWPNKYLRSRCLEHLIELRFGTRFLFRKPQQLPLFQTHLSPERNAKTVLEIRRERSRAATDLNCRHAAVRCLCGRPELPHLIFQLLRMRNL